MLGDAGDLVLGDEGALDPLQLRGAGAAEKHVALAEQRLGAPWSRITRESVCEETAKAIRAGMLTLIVPVMMSVEGRWVASTRWMPVARDFWARRMIESSTSAGATIIRSASSSITQRMCGSGGSPALVRARLSSSRLRQRAWLMIP